jgi:MFS family permease
VDIYVALLRQNRNYRYLWLGAVVSQFGDWFNIIASASLITELTDAGTNISYLFLARFLSLFLFSPLAGVLADRYERRTILIASDLLRALTVLGFLLVRQSQDIWLLYALTATQFALSAIFVPARSAVIANVVSEKELVTASTLDSFTWSTMLALGALFGGLVTAWFGAQTAFVLDAITFLGSAWLISQVVVPARAMAVAGRRSGGWLDFLDGLRYLRGESFILIISLVKGAGSFVWGAINVLEVTFAEKIFPIEGNVAATLTLVYALSGVGTGIGPLLLRRWFGDEPVQLRRAIVVGFVSMTAGIFIVSLAPNIVWFAVGTLVRTLGTGTVWVFSAALLQTVVPDRFRGRVFAFEFAFLTLTQSVSTVWAGYGQDNLGLAVQQIAAMMGGLGVVMTVGWLLFHLYGAGRLAAQSLERGTPMNAD